VWQNLKRLSNYIKPYTKEFITGLICLILMNIANLTLPWVIKVAVDYILSKGHVNLLNTLVGGALFVMLLKGIFYYGQKYLLTFAIQRMIVDLRNEAFENLQYLSLSFHEKNRTGDSISRLINDINVIRDTVVMAFTGLMGHLLMISGILVMMFYINWRLALISILIFPGMAYAMNKFGAKMRTISRQVQMKAADITAILQESLLAIRVVKAFTREEYEIERFAQENQRNFDVTMKAAQIEATLPPIVEFLAAAALLVIVWYGGHQVITGALSLSEFLAFMIYLGMASNPINGISVVGTALSRSAPSLERIFEIIDADDREEDSPGAYILPPIQGRVEFRDVSFSYNGSDKKALEGLSLIAEPGEVIALVGPSGAGKTTMANLILRFYDPTSGGVYVDGHDLKEVSLKSFRKQVAIVPQETILFSGTIADNIAYGKDHATYDEIVQAAKSANAHDFIEALPEGYYTCIGEGGIGLSGGQKQRISIARALLRAPRILILDEATSALDVESEYLVKEALDRLMTERTTFIIAHRLSTIQNATRIAVLDRGELVELGTHDELIAADGLYARLYKYQDDNIVG
jgi:subfamily B ATP-binding cassette protein MsbA